MGSCHRSFESVPRGHKLATAAESSELDSGARQLLLHLIGFVAGRDCLIRIGKHYAVRWLVLASRNGRLRGLNIGLGRFHLGLPGLMEFVVKLVLRFLEFLHRLTHSACELGQFLRAEQNQNNQQDNDQIRSGQIHKAGKEVHRVD